MKGDAAATRVLNESLKVQLTAINQFFLHARMLKNWGLSELNDRAYQQSVKAMKQADALVKRVLFLEGLPNLQDLGKLMIGEDVSEILKNDLQFQTEARRGMQAAVSSCETARDYVSRDLLEGILEETEEHIDWLESQHWLMTNMGLENYLQSQI
jgi:bacterioferritin